MKIIRRFFARSRTLFVVNFSNCPLLWVSKLQTDIDLYTLHSEYVEFSRSVRELLTLNLTKEVIDNLRIDSEMLKFVSRSTANEENNGSIFVAKIQGWILHQITLLSSIIGSGISL